MEEMMYVSLLQVALVPWAASRRGRDPAIWFIVTVIWLPLIWLVIGPSLWVASLGLEFVAIDPTIIPPAELALFGLVLVALLMMAVLPLVSVLAFPTRRPKVYRRRRPNAAKRVRRRQGLNVG